MCFMDEHVGLGCREVRGLGGSSASHMRIRIFELTNSFEFFFDLTMMRMSCLLDIPFGYIQ